MPTTRDGRAHRIAAHLAAALAALALAAPVVADTPKPPAPDRAAAQRIVPTPHPTLDRSGHKRTGKASYYADFFAGRKMANGQPFRPDTNNAASRSLPLGTTARVTNLDNGRSAVVVIEDRGPYIEGRIVDVSPSTAEQLDMVDDGVVPVEVVPLALPARKGSRRGTDVAEADAGR